MRLGLSIAAMLLLLAGCGDSDDGGGDKAAEPTTTPAETVTATVTESPTTICEPPSRQQASLLAFSWSLVVASHGASDHPKYAEEFFDYAAELSEDFEDGDCEGDPTADTASQLAYEASVVQAYSRIGGGQKNYANVVRVGNKLMEEMGTSSQFVPLTCTGQVDETPDCSVLTD